MDNGFAATFGYAVGLAALMGLTALRSYVKSVAELLLPPVLIMWNTPLIAQSSPRLLRTLRRHLVYRGLFRDGGYLDACSRAQAVFFALYLAANLCSLLVRVSSVEDLHSRAGTLAVVNLLPLYCGPCLSFAADLFQFPLFIQVKVHAAAGFIVGLLATVHAFGAIASNGGLSVRNTGDLLAILALLGKCLLLLPIGVFSKLLPYELLLFTHRSLSLLILCAIWVHLPAARVLPRACVCAVAGLFLALPLFQCAQTLYQRRGCFVKARLSDCDGQIHMIIHPRQPVRVKPGQYVNLWVPTSLFALVQMHPFSVASWLPDPQRELVLLIQVQAGFTRSLVKELEYGDTSKVVMFTGPHGQSLPLLDYDEVFLIASDFGIVALLPYLNWIIYMAHALDQGDRRVHLVWQLQLPELPKLIGEFLNRALQQDAGFDGGDDEGASGKVYRHVANISLYLVGAARDAPDSEVLEPRMQAQDEQPPPPDGSAAKGSRRVVLYRDQMRLDQILDRQMTHGASGKPRGVAASASREIRDELTRIAGLRVADMELMFTEYQP